MCLNVYRIRSACEVERPGKGLRQIYASAPGSPRGLDLVEHFDGKPYPAKWPASVTLALHKPKLPRPDFIAFRPKVLLCGARAVEVVGELMRSSGELFPVKVRGVDGTCQLLNVTRLLGRALDPAKSVYREGDRSYRPLKRPAFRADKIGRDVSLFKLPQNHGNAIYCVERTGDPDDSGEFKALVELHGLKGLEFDLVWSSGDGGGEGTKRPVARKAATARRRRGTAA
jgi:hypothetical protein